MDEVKNKLYDYLKQYPRVAVAFSGGVDSSYLLYAAKDAGCDVRAYYINSQFQPKFELEDAQRLAESIGASLTIGSVDALSDPNIWSNPNDRCYHCKNAVFSKIWELARADGISVLFDGTNADDDESDRAGMVALRELEVVSPLRECGLTKSDIRRFSLEAGLFTHDKPSYACLATRIPTGTDITEQDLERVEITEDLLFKMGFTDFRIRLIPPNDAKLQIHATQWVQAAEMREDILSALSQHYDNVLLDLNPRYT